MKLKNANNSEKRCDIIEALGYLNIFRNKVFVIKLDGAVIAADKQLKILEDVKLLSDSGIKIILVHGGKDDINKRLEEQGLESQTHNGERITPIPVLEIIKEVYLEKITPKLSRHLKEVGVSISGRNCNFLKCKKRKINETALGMVGEITSVDTTILNNLLNCGLVPIVSPLGIDENGHTCNILPESVALHIAKEIHAEKLIFLTKKDGILDLKGQIIHEIDLAKTLEMKAKGEISESMFPKIDATARALSFGISSIHIINGTTAHALFDEIISHNGVGTMFTNATEAEKRRKLIDKMKGVPEK